MGHRIQSAGVSGTLTERWDARLRRGGEDRCRSPIVAWRAHSIAGALADERARRVPRSGRSRRGQHQDQADKAYPHARHDRGDRDCRGVETCCEAFETSAPQAPPGRTISWSVLTPTDTKRRRCAKPIASASGSRSACAWSDQGADRVRLLRQSVGSGDLGLRQVRPGRSSPIVRHATGGEPPRRRARPCVLLSAEFYGFPLAVAVPQQV